MLPLDRLSRICSSQLREFMVGEGPKAFSREDRRNSSVAGKELRSSVKRSIVFGDREFCLI